MSSNNKIQHVSDTAFWMASYRAKESERKNSLFRDPLAKVLIGERGKAISDSMAPVERYAYWSLVIRTRLIDDYLLNYTKSVFRTIINLGAGLDTRPYRLNLPEGVTWIEIDFPGVIDMKNEKLSNEKPNCRLERIAMDLSDRSARQKGLAEINSRIGPAIVLTEGVVPYLTEEMVTELATDLKALSNIKLWISEYTSPALYPRLQAQALASRLANSPFRFFPRDWIGFFENAGWHKKEMRYLYDEGEKLNRSFPLPWWVQLLKRFVDPEKVARRVRLQGYAVFEKAKT